MMHDSRILQVNDAMNYLSEMILSEINVV